MGSRLCLRPAQTPPEPRVLPAGGQPGADRGESTTPPPLPDRLQMFWQIVFQEVVATMPPAARSTLLSRGEVYVLLETRQACDCSDRNSTVETSLVTSKAES